MLLFEYADLFLETNAHHRIYREGGAQYPIASGFDAFHLLSIIIIVAYEELSNDLEASHRNIHHLPQCGRFLELHSPGSTRSGKGFNKTDFWF